MTEAVQHPYRSQNGTELLVVDILRYLDGVGSEGEICRLKSALVADPACRRVFVQLCRLQGNLQESFARARGELLQKKSDVQVPANEQSLGAETVVLKPSAADTVHRAAQPPAT